MIRDVFSSDSLQQRDGLNKRHNFRSLICALRDFYPVYELLKEKNIPGKEKYLSSFITYMMIWRNGIFRDGNTSFDVTLEDVLELYPDYSAEAIPGSVRRWVEYGIWDEDKITEELSLSSQSLRFGRDVSS